MIGEKVPKEPNRRPGGGIRHVDPGRQATIWCPHVHVAVRATWAEKPFECPEVARESWRMLRSSFPGAAAAVLMPNHLHLLTPANSRVLRDLYPILGRISARLKKKHLWQKISPPVPIPDLEHMRRQIRYVALNPSRKGLCRDPLEWLWSTYREVFGTVAHPWGNRRLIEYLFGGGNRGLERFHEYVSSDPSVEVRGTPFPNGSVRPETFATESVATMLAVCVAVTHREPGDVRIGRSVVRELFLRLSKERGWDLPSALASLCGMGRQGVYKTFERSSRVENELVAARMCLGDPRFIRLLGTQCGVGSVFSDYSRRRRFVALDGESRGGSG